MENKIKDILATVLEIDSSIINEDSSPDTIEAWDSLKHINLILAFENEFDIEFEDEDIVNMLSLSSIITTIKNKLDA